MNSKLKKNLRSVFDAPAPERKAEFILALRFPKSRRRDFLLAQIGYIRKRVWIETLILLLPALALPATPMTDNVLGFVWVVSSLLPFVVLVGMTEIARSISHGMAELEKSCKYGFSDVVLARLWILACADMLLFAAITVSLGMADSGQVLRLALYLFVPFLLTCSLSLFAFNRLATQEGGSWPLWLGQKSSANYICGGMACGVSILNVLLSTAYRGVFSDGYVAYWGMVFVALLIWTAGEARVFVREATNES